MYFIVTTAASNGCDVKIATKIVVTGRMKLRDLKPGEHRYAVAVREGSDLFMTLFIRRDPKGDVYVMIPRRRGSENPHASYHRDGTLHHKNYDRPMMPSDRQSLIDGGFKGCEHICMFGEHAPKVVGVTCDASKLTGIVEVPDEILSDGYFAVDLVEPGCENQVIDLCNPVHSRHVFKEAEPWLVIRAGKHRKFWPAPRKSPSETCATWACAGCLSIAAEAGLCCLGRATTFAICTITKCFRETE